MRTERNTLLAGIAAIALLAGTGFASAQEPQDHNMTPQAKQPEATHKMEMNKGPATGKMGQSAQEQKTTPRAAEMKSNTTNKAAQIERNKEGATKGAKEGTMARTEKTKLGKTAERTRMSHKSVAMHERGTREHHARMAKERNHMTRRSTAQREPNGMQKFGERQHNGFEGLQGNAAGGNVQLSEEQRTRIRTTVLNGPRVPRVSNVGFPVVAGTVIPRGSVDAVPVPSSLARINPQWRGFLYFVWNDQLVIVSPRDMRIVAVVYV